MKRIVYVATDSGMDGMAPTKVLYASFDEAERDAMIEADKSKPWRSKDERIIDVDHAIAKALSKLDGIDRLVLGLKPWPDKTAGCNDLSSRGTP